MRPRRWETIESSRSSRAASTRSHGRTARPRSGRSGSRTAIRRATQTRATLSTALSRRRLARPGEHLLEGVLGEVVHEAANAVFMREPCRALQALDVLDDRLDRVDEAIELLVEGVAGGSFDPGGDHPLVPPPPRALGVVPAHLVTPAPDRP